MTFILFYVTSIFSYHYYPLYLRYALKSINKEVYPLLLLRYIVRFQQKEVGLNSSNIIDMKKFAQSSTQQQQFPISDTNKDTHTRKDIIQY
jgi:hypothetical protein